ncbi:TonB family protein [Microbulbifer sp. SH-1]|uniref:energy transducer TonB n=1 Tax=Microbulbifer sp. SH-1 TaxID=2681547 RepID=UPI0014093EFE|nr:energy transducer TonB [Microbulbifer sp. SH-1]QIL91350.1 TonB family protein [Microbulbifer sp. SH-1]
MKLRLTVMVVCSLALHAWLLWAAPAQEVRAPSGTVALKLGQLKLAAETQEQETESQPVERLAEQQAVEVPAPKKERGNKEPVKTLDGKAPEQKAPVANEEVAAQRDSTSGSKTDSAVKAQANVAAAPVPQSAQRNVSEEPVLVERPVFAHPPGAPVYPELARQRRQQGTVVVEVQLDHTGAQLMRRLLQSSGVDSLDQAALTAVAKWEFLPYREDGRARLARVQLPIRFSL